MVRHLYSPLSYRLPATDAKKTTDYTGNFNLRCGTIIQGKPFPASKSVRYIMKIEIHYCTE